MPAHKHNTSESLRGTAMSIARAANYWGVGKFAVHRYGRRTLTWQCFIMFYLKTNASSTVNRNLTEHAALGMQVGKI